MVGCWVQRAIGAGRVIAGAALIAGCTQVINNDPINQPLTVNARAIEAELRPEVETSSDDMIVALSFSGGGMRAAAFSYGVLTGFDETRVRARQVLLVSVIYLPLIYGLMVLDRPGI